VFDPAQWSQQKLLIDLRTGFHNHGSVHTQSYPRRPWYNCQGHCSASTSEYLFCTQLEYPAYSDWHYMPIIPSEPTRPPWLHANILDCVPDLPWSQTPGESCVERQGSKRQVAEVLISAIRKDRAASAPEHRSPADSRPLIPSSIQDNTRVRNRLRRQWLITRSPG
jgi:hypothetical protein